MAACFGIVTVALAPEISTFSGARPTSLGLSKVLAACMSG